MRQPPERNLANSYDFVNLVLLDSPWIFAALQVTSPERLVESLADVQREALLWIPIMQFCYWDVPEFWWTHIETDDQANNCVVFCLYLINFAAGGCWYPFWTISCWVPHQAFQLPIRSTSQCKASRCKRPGVLSAARGIFGVAMGSPLSNPLGPTGNPLGTHVAFRIGAVASGLTADHWGVAWSGLQRHRLREREAVANAMTNLGFGLRMKFCRDCCGPRAWQRWTSNKWKDK